MLYTMLYKLGIVLEPDSHTGSGFETIDQGAVNMENLYIKTLVSLNRYTTLKYSSELVSYFEFQHLEHSRLVQQTGTVG